MTKKNIFIFAAAVATALYAAPKQTPVEEARTKFHLANNKAFFDKKAVPSEIAEDFLRYDKAQDKAEYRAVMQLTDDGRLMFVDFEGENGKFLKGTLKMFGLPEEAIDAKGFEALRAEKPMAVSNLGLTNMVTVLYHPESKSGRFRPEREANIWFDPQNYYYGGFQDAAGSMGFHKWNKFETWFHGDDGLDVQIKPVKRFLDKEATLYWLKAAITNRAKASPKKLETTDVKFHDGGEITRGSFGFAAVKVPRVLLPGDDDIEAGRHKDGTIDWAKVDAHFKAKRDEWQKLHDIAISKERGLDPATTVFLSEKDICEYFWRGEIEYRIVK